MSTAINTNSNFLLKRLSELQGMTFLVEAYQRGYKWDVQQVLDLLNDINDFEAVGSRFYCLQPVVVTKINASDLRIAEMNTENVYELIDGQQRLTTTFIILSLLAKEKSPFQLIYKTRKESESFLNDIATIQTVEFSLQTDNVGKVNAELNGFWKNYIENNPENNNVDNYHFYKACQLIHQWSKGKEIDEVESFIDKLLQHVKIIWYNIQSQPEYEMSNVQIKNAEQIFINFNQGKIHLEQAELIKALFVIRFKDIVNLEIRSIHINQFADEWNKIESKLQDDQFWYFVSNDISDRKRYNRIDFLFDILAGKPAKSEDNLFAYHFYLKSNNSIDQAISNWKRLKDLYELLKEWHEERLLYHLIGIVVYLDIRTISQLIDIYNDRNKVKNKTDFEKVLKSIISKELKKPDFDLTKLDYKSPYESQVVLHLFNIASYYISDFNYRFPFDKLKTQTWSLEHIHAQRADKFSEKQEFIDWLEDIKPLLIDTGDEGKQEELEILLEELKTKSLREIKDRLLNFYTALGNILNKDNLDNLCLLDTRTNSSLGNKNFKDKRKLILNIDNSGEVKADGENVKVFIPIGTKNVFLKYYSTALEDLQFTYWGKSDRGCYIYAIEEQLFNFLRTD